MLENTTYSEIVGSVDPHTGAPFMNSLLPIAANMTQSVGNTHPTDPNYLYFFSGSNQGITGNSDPRKGNRNLNTANLGRNLLNAGFTFLNYAQNLGTVGNTAFSINGPDGIYYMEENVAGYWVGNSSNQLPSNTLQPLETSLPSDYSQLPTVSFWHPVEDHDMHQGYPNERVNDGDNWVKNTIANYVQWAMKNNSLLILSWDESQVANEDPLLYNHIPTLFVGPMVQPGNYSQSINHNNVLRTIEDMFGLAHAGAAATATPISGIWKTTATPIVSLDSPTNYAHYQAPATITLDASVTPNGHTINKVQFYNGTTLLGEDTSAPYSLTWTNAPSDYFGYSLSAKAIYDTSSTTSSAPVVIAVYPTSASLSQGLNTYLNFDGNIDAQGGTAVNGTIFPAGKTARYVTGKFSQAASFQNTGGSGLPSDWTVSLGVQDSAFAGDFTYSLWVKTNSTTDTAIIGNKNYNSGANIGWLATTYPSAKTYNWNAASGNRHDVGTYPRISGGSWHFLTQTYNRASNQVTSYIDGKPNNVSTVKTTSGSASLSSGLATLIGSSGPGYWAATADIDDVAIWTRVLSPIEIASIYAAGQTGQSLGQQLSPSSPPSVATTQSTVAVNAPISVNFSNGPGNASDWIGLYTAGSGYGSGTPSIKWLYTNGTQSYSGATGPTSGTVTFNPGLTPAGSYTVRFLANDGYTVLAESPFMVQ